MAVTARKILDMALVLIDEVSESGGVFTETPLYYETKAITFLTLIQAELLPPIVIPPILTSLDNTLILTDNIALRVVPYGLAAKIALAEDLNLSVILNNIYDEMKRKIYVDPIPILDVYNITEVSD